MIIKSDLGYGYCIHELPFEFYISSMYCLVQSKELIFNSRLQAKNQEEKKVYEIANELLSDTISKFLSCEIDENCTFQVHALEEAQYSCLVKSIIYNLCENKSLEDDKRDCFRRSLSFIYSENDIEVELLISSQSKIINQHQS